MRDKALLDAKGVARLAGVRLSTVEKWVQAKRLIPRAWTPGGRPRYHPDDVLHREKPVRAS